MRRVLTTLVVTLLLASAPAGAVTVERVVSPGGIEAWLVQDHSNPIITLELAFRGGAAAEPTAKPGIATMVAGLLDEGAGPYDSQSFQAKLEDLAITLRFEAGRDTFRGHLQTLTENRDTAFDLFRLALTQPRFDKEPIERVRGQILTMLAHEMQSPDAIAARRWFALEYQGHPYAIPVHGTIDSVKTIQVGDLRSWTKAHLGRDQMIVAVVGDITPEVLGPLLDHTFGAIPAKASNAEVAEGVLKANGRVEIIPRDNPQSTCIFGLPGIKRQDPDWYTAYVMNYILGDGGFASWLTEEVREKRGLAYSVGTALSPMVHGAQIIGSVATENSRLSQSLDVIRQQFIRMRDQGPTEDDLINAKTYLNGAFPLQLDSTASVAGLLVTIQLENLGIDYLDRRRGLIDKVTLDDVKRVAKRLLDPEALTMVVVGKPDGLTAK